MPLERLDNIVPLKFGFGLTQVSACGKEIMCQLPLHRLEVERHVFKVEDTVTAEDHQSFDHVLQLANIPWPMIMGQERQRLCGRSEEHTSELQSLAYLVCRLLLEKKKKIYK